MRGPVGVEAVAQITLHPPPSATATAVLGVRTGVRGRTVDTSKSSRRTCQSLSAEMAELESVWSAVQIGGSQSDPGNRQVGVGLIWEVDKWESV